MKRSDLTTEMVLRTIAEHQFNAWERLTEQFPPKIVVAALMREEAAERIDYGVALHRPWLTGRGWAYLR